MGIVFAIIGGWSRKPSLLQVDKLWPAVEGVYKLTICIVAMRPNFLPLCEETV